MQICLVFITCVLHRIDDLEIKGCADEQHVNVLHRIDDLERFEATQKLEN